MIRTLGITQNLEIIKDIPLKQLPILDLKWYWVDFDAPTETEAKLLDEHFHFHPLAIEDCFHLLQRPKLDHYEDVHFFVLHAINGLTLAAEEVDLFLGKNFIVTFHFNQCRAIEDAWSRIAEQKKSIGKGHVYAAYLVMDKLVDQYFPSVYQIEEELNEIENDVKPKSVQRLMDDIFEIRAKLLKLRRTIVPMRELLYRIVNTERIEGLKEMLVYFTDIHDHLVRLAEMIESNKDLTADMRDSYVSINSNRMNNIMKTLTVMSSIFIPLTFIASIYGMNFERMPELTWDWGYFMVLGIMLVVGSSLVVLLWRKGWFK
jgi:magnesium transporter